MNKFTNNVRFENTCVTQKADEYKHSVLEMSIDYSSLSKSQDEIIETEALIDEASSCRKESSKSSKNSDCKNGTKVIRRDVLNKTIFRIIRRYFLMLLENAIPDYKNQKKDNMMGMLTKLAKSLILSDNYTAIAQVMGALMFRRELLLSKTEIANNPELKVFLDIQSKYSHKLLKPALSNKYFGILFDYFISNGNSFFASDENVKSNFDLYSKELQKIRSLYGSLSYNNQIGDNL